MFENRFVFTQTFFFNSESLRKNLWDAEDRLRAVDLNPEADSDKPLIAVYTYDAGGERTIKYVPARTDARYSAKNTGNADRFESIISPNALLTAKALDFVEQLEYRKDPKVVNYTKHYYIGSERIASSIGTYRGTGGYKGTERDAVRVYMNNKVTEVAEVVRQDFEKLEKHVQLAEPFVYDAGFDDPWYNFHDPEYYSTYWYHPDHLGSSSYITNLEGEISQHMEYLPFGETLVEEHLNSNNSPYKFNAKEFDAETGNYYYGARYYDPKWSIWLFVDAEFAKFPAWSPYNYTLQNPINLIDPDGNAPIDPIKQVLYKRTKGITGNYHLKGFNVVPASTKSWSGITAIGSITKDGQRTLTKALNIVFDVNSPQYVRSASISTAKNKGQYLNNKGEEVENISNATQLIISEYQKTETVNLYEGGVYGDITIEESVRSIIFDVIEGENLSFSDSVRSSANRTKSVAAISEELANIVEEFSLQNQSNLESQKKQRNAKIIEGNLIDNHDAIIREAKQDKLAN